MMMLKQLILEDLRNRIRHALLNDKLGQVQNTKMTATEVLERSAEMIRILGAVYARLQTELLTPLIERGLSILRRRGEVPILFLDGQFIKITYQSPVADLQNQRQANEVMNLIHSFTDMKMDAFQFIDVYGLAKWLANQLNMPMDLIKSPQIETSN